MEILLAALKLAPLVIQAGEDFASFVGLVEDASKRADGPTDEDWAALHQLESGLRARLEQA
jgi:hypothetical protein